jgi:hypothetical protein
VVGRRIGLLVEITRGWEVDGSEVRVEGSRGLWTRRIVISKRLEMSRNWNGDDRYAVHD